MFDISKLKIQNIKELVNGRLDGEVIGQNAEALSIAGNNYITCVLKFDLQVKHDDKIETVQTVAKLVPRGELEKGDTSFCAMVFSKEIFWYRDVVPLLADFEKECGVTGYTSIYPKFYGARMNLMDKPDMVDENAIVLIEYLKDYVMGDRHEGLDLESSKAILKAMVKFHSLIIALKLKKPQVFKEKLLGVLEAIPPPPPQKHKKDDSQKQEFLGAIKEDPKLVHLIPKVEKALEVSSFFNSFKPREPWGTICHHNMWLTNFMVNPRNKDAKVLDFQTTVYKSLTTDLLFFLLTSVEASVMKSQFKYLIQYYYDRFIEALKEMHVDTTPFTYESYMDDLKFNLQNGQLGHSFMFAKMLKREKGEGSDIVMEAITHEMAKKWFSINTPGVKEQIQDIVRVCDEMNWL